jgi:hypothetical protein
MAQYLKEAYNMRIKDIFINFQQDDMYDADARRRIHQLIDDYFHVVNSTGDISSPFDRMLAGYAIDKWTEYEEALWARGKKEASSNE